MDNIATQQAKTQAEALRKEIEALRAERDAIVHGFDSKIGPKEDRLAKLMHFLEIEAELQASLLQTEPSPTPQPAPLEPASPPKPTALSELLANFKRKEGVRRPYGAMIAAVQMCVQILRETGKPWHTRDLVPELERRGLPLGGDTAVTNLSNRLGRSNLVRSHKVLGWHLAEWPDFPDPAQERIAIMRAQMQMKHEPKTQPLAEAKKRAFHGMGLPEAAISVITDNGRPTGNTEIASILEKADFPFKGKDFTGQIESTLKRRANSNDESSRVVIRVAAGTWGLASWYTPEQAAQFAQNLGGMPGRDQTAHLEKTRAGIQQLRERGVRLGRAPLFSDEQMEAAKQAFFNGTPLRDIANAMGVTLSGAGKWRAKWLAGAEKTDQS